MDPIALTGLIIALIALVIALFARSVLTGSPPAIMYRAAPVIRNTVASTASTPLSQSSRFCRTVARSVAASAAGASTSALTVV